MSRKRELFGRRAKANYFRLLLDGKRGRRGRFDRSKSEREREKLESGERERERGEVAFSSNKCYTFLTSSSPAFPGWVGLADLQCGSSLLYCTLKEEGGRKRIDERDGGKRSVKISLQAREGGRKDEAAALMLRDGLLSVKQLFSPFRIRRAGGLKKMRRVH